MSVTPILSTLRLYVGPEGGKELPTRYLTIIGLQVVTTENYDDKTCSRCDNPWGTHDWLLYADGSYRSIDCSKNHRGPGAR